MSADDEATAELIRWAVRNADMLTRIARLAASRRGTGLVIPVVDQDPDVTDLTNLWGFADGRLRFRPVPGGSVFQFMPYDPNTAQPPVPTFSSNPAFSSGWRLWFDGGTAQLRGFLANGTVVSIATSGASSSAGGTPTAPGPTSGTAKPADPRPKGYWQTYNAQWATIFCQVHGVESASKETHYGRFDDTHGERRVMFGFDDAAMRADMLGASIDKAFLHMTNTYSWGFGGISVHFGLHNSHSSPGSFQQTRENIYVGSWPESGDGPGDGFRGIAPSILARFRDDTAKGLTIDQPTTRTYYGACDWTSVKLKVRYVK